MSFRLTLVSCASEEYSDFDLFSKFHDFESLSPGRLRVARCYATPSRIAMVLIDKQPASLYQSLDDKPGLDGDISPRCNPSWFECPVPKYRLLADRDAWRHCGLLHCCEVLFANSRL